MKACISRSLGILHRPAAFPVENHRHLRRRMGTGHLLQLLQRLAHLGHLAKGSGVVSSVVVDDRPVELLAGASAFAQLEILDTVGSMGNGLHGSGVQHARTFQLTHRLPVGGSRTALHQQERPFLDAPHDIMLHSIVHGSQVLFLLMPLGIIIPRYNIYNIRKFVIIQPLEIIHHIDGGGFVGAAIPNGLNFMLHKIHRPVGDKPFPVQIQSMHRHLAPGRRAFNLVETVVGMAPEGGGPGLVEPVNGLIFFFQPFPERLLAQRTVAFAPVLIGQMPGNYAWMISELFCQFFIDDPYFFPIYRGGIAMIVPCPEQVSGTIRRHPQHLRILVRHPFGPGAGGCSQHGGNSVFIQAVNDFFHPVEIKYALFRLQLCPGENSQGYFIDLCLFEIFDILLQDLRHIQPLFRIIIAAVDHFSKIYFLSHLLPPSDTKSAAFRGRAVFL